MGILQKTTLEYGGFHTISDYVGFDNLDKYCNRIYQHYCSRFENASYLKNVEWLLRHYNASKKITLCALFYTQTKYLHEHKVKNISFYSLYYSLYNAFSSNLLLLPHLSLKQIRKISHSEIFNHTENYFVRFGIYTNDAINLLNELRLMREAYSYYLPLGGSFAGTIEKFTVNDFLKKLESLLPIVLQTSNLLSYLSYYAWNKKVGKALDEYSKFQQEADQMFFSFIEHHDHLGKYCLIDEDDYQRQGEALNKWGTPFPISWFITDQICEDLECGWEDDSVEGYDISEVEKYLAQIMS